MRPGTPEQKRDPRQRDPVNGPNKAFFEALAAKARWVAIETLKLHRRSPETRIASSLSAIELLVVLYYGGILRFDPKMPAWKDRDRFIASKGHGVVCLYPILSDLGFFPKEELETIGRNDSRLGIIPDTRVPGLETNNGSLGHGLGVACGIAVALKAGGSDRRVFVVAGDGEFNEGSMWEAVMFAAHHRLDNLILLVDDNKKSMLGLQGEILGLNPLAEKFSAFHWKASEVDGHDVRALYEGLISLTAAGAGKPQVLVASTVKGKGVPALEQNPLCHVMSLSAEQVDRLIEDWK